MGLPPVLGVFTSILTAPITAFPGRNPVLIGGTSAVTVPFIATAVRHQGLLSHVPLAALAGVTAYMGLRLLEWSTRRRLPKTRLIDAASFLLTAAATLAINAVAAIALGCAV